MQKHKQTIVFLAITAVFALLTACTTETVYVEVTTVVEETEVITEVVNVTTTPLPTAETAVSTPEPTPEPTATLSGIRATMAAAMVVTPNFGDSTSETIANDDYTALTQQACDIVQESYVRDNFNGADWPTVCQTYQERATTITSQDAFWDMMEEMIGELNDNHSRFVRPDGFAGEFDLPSEGTGRAWPGLTINPAREDEQLLIWDVCTNGPAASAGIERGDVVLAINGQPIERGEEGYDRAAIYGLLYDDEADSATFTLLQGEGKKPTDITVNYGGANGCDYWGYGLLSEEPRIGYIRILDFSGDSDTLILEYIQAMEEGGALDGLVLDIRHNPGGNSDKDIAIFTAGQFGLVGSLREGATQTIYRIRGPIKWNETTPVVVLTDGATHSAGEYFSTAMQQSGRATIVGMPTAGNTEGINSFNLSDGSVIRMAHMTLQLPDGNTLEGVGVVPDVMVPLGDWGLRGYPDIQLQTAYDLLTK